MLPWGYGSLGGVEVEQLKLSSALPRVMSLEFASFIHIIIRSDLRVNEGEYPRVPPQT